MIVCLTGPTFNFNFNSSSNAQKLTELSSRINPKDLTNTSLEEELEKLVNDLEVNYPNEHINLTRELIALLKNYKGQETAERGEK